ncbi:MAG: alpha/beta hydrolase [Acidimicrobiales bacterium]
MPLNEQAQFLIAASAALELPVPPELGVEEARLNYDGRTRDVRDAPDVGSIDDRTIPGPGGPLAIRIYRPIDAPELAPALVYFHGGGWVFGTLETHDAVCRAMCALSSAVVVSVDYRLAPESPFPAAPDDAEAATVWVIEHGDEIGVDGARVAVGGDSAGGSLATVVAQQFSRAGGPDLAAQVLVYPSTELADVGHGSHVENGEGLLLTAAFMRWFSDHYVPDPADRTDLRASPARGELAGLPPAFVLTAEYDPLRDEGNAYAAALAAAGVDVEHHVFPGQVHSFFTQYGLIDDSNDAVARIAAFLSSRL